MAVATHVRRCSLMSILVISEDKHIAYSECGMPFALSGSMKGLDDLIVRKPKFFKEMDIEVFNETSVGGLDTEKRLVHLDGKTFSYQNLVIATGGKPFIPDSTDGYQNIEGVFTLHQLSDAIRIEAHLQQSKSAVIIGAGAIGIEIAASLNSRGIKTTLINRSESILSKQIDTDMASIVQQYLEDQGINVITGNLPDSIDGDKKVRSVTINSRVVPADTVIFSTGIKPRVHLAEQAGILIGDNGGILVNEKLNVLTDKGPLNEIYSGGDCCEVIDQVTGLRSRTHLATTARRMALVIANNICGKNVSFPPVLGPWIIIASKLRIGSVGITSKKATTMNLNLVSGTSRGLTRSSYYPGATEIYIKLLFIDGYLEGAQIIGEEGIKERIDCLSFMIKKRTTIKDIMEMETCYAPPVSTLVDPLIYAAKDAYKKLI